MPITAATRSCARCSTAVTEALPAWALAEHAPIAYDLEEEFEQDPGGPYVLVDDYGDLVARQLRPGQIPAARRHQALWRRHAC